jgi:hypothetical protein
VGNASLFTMNIDRGTQVGDLIDSEGWQQRKPIDMGTLGGGEDTEDTYVEIWHKPQP